VIALANSRIAKHGLELLPLLPEATNHLTRHDTGLMAANKTRVWEQAERQLAAYSKRASYDHITAHNMAMLKALCREYSSSSNGSLPTSLPLMEGQETPLDWEPVQRLCEKGEWTDDNVVDWLIKSTPKTLEECDFLSTDDLFYRQTLWRASTTSRQQQDDDYMGEFQMTKSSTPAPTVKLRARKLVFAWNPFGMQWIVVRAAALEGGVKTITRDGDGLDGHKVFLGERRRGDRGAGRHSG
jgi:hypothetical protein